MSKAKEHGKEHVQAGDEAPKELRMLSLEEVTVRIEKLEKRQKNMCQVLIKL